MLRIGDSVSAVMTESGATRPYDNTNVQTCVLSTQEQLDMARTGMTVYFTPAAAQAALDKGKLTKYQQQHSYMDDAQYAACVEARDWSGADLRAEELDKAKASTLPEGVAPVPEDYEFVDPKKEPETMPVCGWMQIDGNMNYWYPLRSNFTHNIGWWAVDSWKTYFARPKAEAEPLKKHGHKGMIHYNNNNTNKWEPDTSALDELAKQAQELHMGYETDKPCVESHETPVGETQGKEVVTDETQPTILEEAAKCVTGPRRRDYGTPDENFGLIASLWSVQLKHEVTPMQVALCLILLKVARQANSPKRDNLVDIAGYAQCASELKGAK